MRPFYTIRPTVLPAAEKLTDYGFVSKVCAVAEAPEGGLKGDELPVPVTEVTEELLRSGRAYFYSSTTYEVTETIEGSAFQIASTSIIELDQIALADARTVYTLTIYNANGTKYDTHKDSVASYIARASDNALHTAIMAFADSAYTYFHG